jgi:cyclic pyranopterin phosphate synthase
MPEDQEFFDRERLLSFEEIATVAGVLVPRGVNKIRLTGGEPLLRREIERLVALLKALPGPPQVVMTTNGMLLERRRRAARRARRLNISLDSLRPERFERIARRPGLAAVLAGIDAARAAGFTRTKLNTVVMGGVNDDEIPALLDFSAERGLEQRFIEFMPMTSNGYGCPRARAAGRDPRRIGRPLEPRRQRAGRTLIRHGRGWHHAPSRCPFARPATACA